MVSLREAAVEDADALARIQSESLRRQAREYYTDEQLAHQAPSDPDAETIRETEFSDDSRHPIIAETDETVTGLGSVHSAEKVLAATFVDPEYIGEGVRRAIVQELETIARREGVERLIVLASLNAVGFYETLGFEPQRERDAGGPYSRK